MTYAHPSRNTRLRRSTIPTCCAQRFNARPLRRLEAVLDHTIPRAYDPQRDGMRATLKSPEQGGDYPWLMAKLVNRLW